RARAAWRWPRATSASSCVARMRTSASSAATKNPFNSTSSNTRKTFAAREMMRFQSMLQVHLAENGFRDVLERDDPDLAPVAREPDRHALAAPLHLAQRDFKAQIFVEINRRANETRQRFGRIEIRLK